MQLNFEDKLAVVQAAQSPGHQAIIELYRAKVNGLTQALLVPQTTVDEDVRLLQEWRGFSSALYFLESLPKIIQAEIQKQQQEGSFSVDPNQASLFAIADTSVPDIMNQTGPNLVKPLPAMHPSNFR